MPECDSVGRSRVRTADRVIVEVVPQWTAEGSRAAMPEHDSVGQARAADRVVAEVVPRRTAEGSGEVVPELDSFGRARVADRVRRMVGWLNLKEVASQHCDSQNTTRCCRSRVKAEEMSVESYSQNTICCCRKPDES